MANGTAVSSKHNQSLGKRGEEIAVLYLTRKGFRIIERNYKARYGEIDIIAQDGDTLVFVEVKARAGTQYGTPQEAVTAGKLREIIKTAEYYATLHPGVSQSMRVDVVAVLLDPETQKSLSIEHIPNVTM